MYPNLGEFFRRRLRDDARPIDPDPRNLISPCDGRVMHAGPIEDKDIKNGHIVNVKVS